MHNKYTRAMLKDFDVVPYDLHKTRKATKKVRPKEIEQFIADRVEKLRELYEKHSPDTFFEMVMPAGETDGRKAMRVEKVIGEDVSPFDLPDFDEQMPKIEDYIIEDEGDTNEGIIPNT